MSLASLVFLGGNGHASARLDAARAELARGPVRLLEARYPGFEGRPRAASFDAFLADVGAQVDAARRAGATAVYATGIGALIALALRAEPPDAGGPGEQGRSHLPLVIQGGVLWGLEQRLFPRLMRGPGPRLLQRALRLPAVQERFVRRHFERPLAPETRAAFFDGYARCASFGDLFRWLRPALLRRLEVRLTAEPGARLADVRCWWGGRDSVVGLDELDRTEARLGVAWPRRVFPDWGHYPMIDEPRAWARELEHAFAGVAPAAIGA